MRRRCEFYLNILDESELQTEKHDLHNISTDDGIIIDFNPVLENIDFSMR
jgi:hypothetical protein